MPFWLSPLSDYHLELNVLGEKWLWSSTLPSHPSGMLTLGLQHGASCTEKPHSALLPTVCTMPQERDLKPRMKHSDWRPVAPRITACHLHVSEARLPLTTNPKHRELSGHSHTTKLFWFFFRFSLFIKACFLFKTLIQRKKLQCQPRALLSRVAN